MIRPTLAGLALMMLALASGSSPAFAQALRAVPAIARVTDETGTLTVAQQAGLTQQLTAFEQRKGAQVALLIVPTTRPETIEQFGIRVTDAWKLGRAATDDGVLLLVALEDRELRIEVGYGFEGVLPDAIARRIIDETIKPRFRENDYFGGVSAGLSRILQVVDGEPLPPPDRQWRQQGDRLGGLLPLLFFGVMAGGGVLRGLLGRPLGALATGGIAGGVVWLLSKIIFMSIGVGVLAFLFALVMGFGNPLRGAGRGRGGFGGFPGGFGGGGFGGGGGGFGGGFRGGGGGFGGGGASGRW